MTGQPMKLSSAFEPFTIALVREIEGYGWTGRLSSKGHAIMRAPDGETTCSVAPKVGDPRNKHNAGMDFRRWLRAQELGVDPADLEDEVVIELRQQLAQAQAEAARYRQEARTWRALAEEFERDYLAALGGSKTR